MGNPASSRFLPTFPDLMRSCATMPTPLYVSILTCDSFHINALLLPSSRAFLLFSQCSLAFFTVCYKYCYVDLSPLSRLATTARVYKH